MKLWLCVVLAGCAVKCDDSNNYYVIQMPDDDPPRDFKKPFRAYWNVPTMQCRSKKIPFQNLHERFGIIQNQNDSFRGEMVAILYDPGVFPALLKNETSGKYTFRNGGVPQEGDLEKHEESFRNVLEQSIPDKDFSEKKQLSNGHDWVSLSKIFNDSSLKESGVGVIDFESWRPVFRQNFGVLTPYKDVSYEIEKRIHWYWPNSWVQQESSHYVRVIEKLDSLDVHMMMKSYFVSFGVLFNNISNEVHFKVPMEAKQRFERSAHTFMQTTIDIAKQMRPRALWGYYGFPYCFNMASNNMAARCADKVPAENDRISWLWSESTALYPSVYSSRDLSTYQLTQLVRGRASEAARVRRNGAPILPYFWFRYRDGGFMSEADLQAVLKTLFKSEASGFIIWGASADVNTVDKCNNLLEYVQKILGPAIAKYTLKNDKYNEELPYVIEHLNSNETHNTISDIKTATTVDPTTKETKENITTENPIFHNKDEHTTTTHTPILKNIEPDLADPTDPEFVWNPPVNYTHDIVKYVEDEFNRNNDDNDIKQKDRNKTVIHNVDEMTLIDLLMKTLIVHAEDNDDKNRFELRNQLQTILTSTVSYKTTTGVDDDYDVKTTYTPLENEIIRVKNQNTREVLSTTDVFTELSTITDKYEDSTKYTTENYYQSTMTEDERGLIYNQGSMFNLDDFLIKHDIETVATELTEAMESKYAHSTQTPYNDEKIELLENITATEKSIESIGDIPTTENVSNVNTNAETSTQYVDEQTAEDTETHIKTENHMNKAIKRHTTITVSENPTASSVEKQVSGSAHISGPKYFCLFFYFYSVSKCLCEYYGQCWT